MGRGEKEVMNLCTAAYKHTNIHVYTGYHISSIGMEGNDLPPTDPTPKPQIP